MIQWNMEFFAAHQDIFLFFGILIFGIPVLLPAVYASMHGFLDPVTVTAAALAAAALSDTIWYTIGFKMGNRIFTRFAFLEKRREMIEGFSHFFRRHSYRMVFASRFAYGTGSITDIIAGIHKLSYPLFIAATFVSMCIWVGLMFLLAYVIGSVDIVKNTLTGIQVGFVVLVGAVVGLRFLFARFFSK